jgi:hypothetical protein
MARHTIKQKNWWDYPVIDKFKTLRISHGQDHVYLRYGIQDSHHVTGYDVKHGTGGGSCWPGRKWGEYASEEIAIRETLMMIKDKYFAKGEPMMIKAIDEAAGYITGSHGCKCHPFTSWKICELFHKRKFNPGDGVLNRCTRSMGTVIGINDNYYIVRYGKRVEDFEHPAQLFPLS